MSESEDFDELFGEEQEEQRISTNSSDQEMTSDNESSAELDELNLRSIKTPSERGYMPYLLKLPGFITCKREAFRGPETLSRELEGQQEFLDMGDLLRARASIRVDTQHRPNSHLNRWSDGTWTLQVGTEHFEVLPHSFRPDEHNLLFERHSAAMEASARLANKLTVRPFMDAQGMHRKYLALAEASGKGMKVTKVRVATTTVDPEREKQTLARMQNERIRARRKLDAKRRNVEQRAFDRLGRDGLSGKFLEEEDAAGDGEDEEDDENEDEYEADFIDDGELEVEEGAEAEEDEEEEEDNVVDEKATSRTSKLIFDDDDDE